MTSKRCLIKKTFPLFHASPLPPLFDFSEPPLKHFPSLVALALMLGSGGSFAAPTPEIARLSLFLFDGEHSYEDRRVVQPVSQFPSHLGVHFESSLNNEGVQVFTWTIKNTGNTPIHNLRFTGLADVDISADTNTFFNEYGTLQSLSVPAGAMAPDKWEIGEPGYHHGDLIARAFTGNLNQRSDHEVATNADDAAMALSLPVEALDAGQTLTLTAWLGNIRQGLQQIDIADQGTIGFLMFATKDQIAPSIQTADYAVTKTALASSVNVGDKTGFQIAVTNLGADAGTGVTLTDIISPELSNLTWRCTVTGNAVCGTTAGTSHAINVTAQIPTGDSVIVRIDGTAGVAGTLINTATIAANEGTVDPNLANNQSTARIVVVDNPPPDPGTDPDTDTHIVNAYGLSHTTLITTGAAVKDGNVYVWGFRGSGQQGNGVLAVTDKTPPAKVKSLSNITHLTGGAYHLVALDQEGNVYGWGQSGYGETGCAPNTLIYVTTPCRVMGNVQAIAAGEYFTVALDKDGNVWTWGHNLYGQLGDGTINNSSAPKKVNLNGEKA
ncbi:MAG: DUF11 domain-containing protein, partial [Burkholderiales bacterium]|nr:DUF11 domain-containing protein [Burkholderiales bacterium]